MRLNDLLRDATGSSASASQRSQHMALTVQLTEKYGDGAITAKAVAKWFERGSIPGPWLMRIAAVSKTKIDLSSYA